MEDIGIDSSTWIDRIKRMAAGARTASSTEKFPFNILKSPEYLLLKTERLYTAMVANAFLNSKIPISVRFNFPTDVAASCFWTESIFWKVT